MQPKVALHNGVLMPLLGLGTYKLTGDACAKAVGAAIDAKYRLLDTASLYKNEAVISRVLTDAGRVPKGDGKNEDDIFIASKIPPPNMGYDGVMKMHKGLRQSLGISKLDLLLLLWPGKQGVKPSSPENRAIRSESWKAMEELYQNGEVRAIGVSNYVVRHLEQLLEDGATVTPMVNQLELHPFCHNNEMDEWARRNGMRLQAYAPLGSGNGLPNDPVIQEVAKGISKTPAQVLLRWALQRDYHVIPRSSQPERVRENADIFNFTLSEKDMQKLNGLERKKHFWWNPEAVV